MLLRRRQAIITAMNLTIATTGVGNRKWPKRIGAASAAQRSEPKETIRLAPMATAKITSKTKTALGR